MMTRLRSARGTAPRPSVPRTWARPPGLALLVLALVALAQGGCRSDGCSNCSFGSKITNGFTNGVAAVGRVFSHDKVGGGCKTCGSSVGEEGGFVEGMPYSAPGAMVVPGPSTIVPAPATEAPPSILEAIPSTSTGPAGSGSGAANPASNRANTGNTRSAYEAAVPRGGSGRGRSSNLARALLSSPEASTRSEEPVDTANLFEKIPPVDVPADVARKAASPPAAAPAVTPSPAPTPVTTNAAPTSAENHSAVEGVAAISPAVPPVVSTIPQAPGIRRSASVAPTVGGGSVPSVEGLDWLKEKGYKTFIDLRAGIEVEPTFADAVNDRGMVYISLPILASRLDSNRLARFDDLISRSENHPLYFCDADGSRAGLVWYLHRRSVSGDDHQSALSKAEEIGLNEANLKLAEAYLVTHKPRPKVAFVAPASVPVVTPELPPAPAATLPPTPAAAPGATVAAAIKNTEPAPVDEAVPTPSDLPEPPVQIPAPSDSESPPLPKIPGEERPQMTAVPMNLLRDAPPWRTVAALVLSSLGIPLAYWSRSAISVARSTVRRASLPAAARRSLESPASSDA